MKLALIADVHANLEGLRACLEHAASQGAERHAFLGDLVGYGADPGPVVDLVRGHVERGALAVKGNHDDAAIAGVAGTMHQAAERAIGWTRAHLSAEQLSFLEKLPLTIQEDRIFLVHASPELPREWI